MNDASAGNYEDMERALRDYLKKPEVWWSEEAIGIMLRANGYCEYCRADVVGSPEAFWSSEHDHVLPKDRGGDDDYHRNLALVCHKCNSIKGEDWPDDVKETEMNDRSGRIAAVRPMVLERRRKQRLIEVYARFREVLELRRAQPEEVSDEA